MAFHTHSLPNSVYFAPPPPKGAQLPPPRPNDTPPSNSLPQGFPGPGFPGQSWLNSAPWTQHYPPRKGEQYATPYPQPPPYATPPVPPNYPPAPPAAQSSDKHSQERPPAVEKRRSASGPIKGTGLKDESEMLSLVNICLKEQEAFRTASRKHFWDCVAIELQKEIRRPKPFTNVRQKMSGLVKQYKDLVAAENGEGASKTRSELIKALGKWIKMQAEEEIKMERQKTLERKKETKQAKEAQEVLRNWQEQPDNRSFTGSGNDTEEDERRSTPAEANATRSGSPSNKDLTNDNDKDNPDESAKKNGDNTNEERRDSGTEINEEDIRAALADMNDNEDNLSEDNADPPGNESDATTDAPNPRKRKRSGSNPDQIAQMADLLEHIKADGKAWREYMTWREYMMSSRESMFNNSTQSALLQEVTNLRKQLEDAYQGRLRETARAREAESLLKASEFRAQVADTRVRDAELRAREAEAKARDVEAKMRDQQHRIEGETLENLKTLAADLQRERLARPDRVPVPRRT